MVYVNGCPNASNFHTTLFAGDTNMYLSQIYQIVAKQYLDEVQQTIYKCKTANMLRSNVSSKKNSIYDINQLLF